MRALGHEASAPRQPVRQAEGEGLHHLARVLRAAHEAREGGEGGRPQGEGPEAMSKHFDIYVDMYDDIRRHTCRYMPTLVPALMSVLMSVPAYTRVATNGDLRICVYRYK